MSNTDFSAKVRIQVNWDSQASFTKDLQSFVNAASKNMGVKLNINNAQEQGKQYAEKFMAGLKSVSQNSALPAQLLGVGQNAKPALAANTPVAAAAKAATDNIKAQNTELVQANKLLAERARLEREIYSYTNKNPRAAAMGTSGLILQLGDSSNDINNKNFDGAIAKIRSVRNEFNQLKFAMKSANMEGNGLLGNIVDMYRRFGGWTLITRTMTSAIRLSRQAIVNVVELDTAMTSLKKVTEETATAYEEYFYTAKDMALSVGATITDTINATADFARLGFELQDATMLAKAALVYKNVGDGIEDINEASQSIISTMMAFNIEASRSMEIVDKYNEIGNNYAISSKGVGEALTRSAAAMAAANNSIDETIGLITAANTVVQNPEVVGTALKTLSMRIRGAKADLESAGEDTEGMAESTAKLQKTLLALTGGQVDIMLDGKTFKSTYQIIQELAAAWDSMSDINRAAALELVAGKRQANIVAAMITNIGVATDATASSVNSLNSAFRENTTYLSSVEGRKALFEASAEALARTAIDENKLKAIIDFGTSLITIIDKITDKVGILTPMVLPLTAALSFLNAKSGLLNPFMIAPNGRMITTAGMKHQMNANALSSLKGFLGAPNRDSNDINNSALFLAANQGISKESYGAFVRENVLSGASNSVKRAAVESLEFQTATSNGQSVIVSAALNMDKYTKSLKAARVAAIATKFATVALNVATMTVATIGITMLIEWIGKLIRRKEEARQVALEATQVYNEESQTLKASAAEIEELRKKLSSNTATEEEALQARTRLLEIQKQLNEQYGKEIGSLNLITAGMDEVNNAIEALNKRRAEEWLIENRESYATAVDEMNTNGRSFISTANRIINHKGFGRGTNVNDNKLFGDLLSGVFDKYTDQGLNAWLYSNSSYTEAGAYDGAMIEFKGDIETEQQVLSDLRRDIFKIMNNMGKQGLVHDDYKNFIESILSNLDNRLITVNKVIEDWKVIYDEGILREIEASDLLTKYRDTATAAATSYSMATSKPKKDIEEVTAASVELINMVNGLYAVLEEDTTPQVKEYFAKFLDAYLDGIDKTTKELALVSNKGDLNNAVMSAFGALADDGGVVSKAKILGISDNRDKADQSAPAKAVAVLSFVAEKAGMSLEELIDTYVAYGKILNKVDAGMYDVISSVTTLSASHTASKEETEKVNKALAEYRATGQLSLETYEALAALSSDYAACLTVENGQIKLNADRLREVRDAREQEVTDEFSEQIESDTERYAQNTLEIIKLEEAQASLDENKKKQLALYKAENEQIRKNITKYSLLRSELRANSTAYKEWQASHEAKSEEGGLFNSYKSAYEDIRKGLETGEMGSAYAAAIKLLIPNGADVQDYFNEVLSPIYSEELPKAATNLIKSLQKEGLMGDDYSMYASAEDISKALNITVDNAHALMDLLSVIGFNIKFINNEIADATKGIDAVDALKARKDDMQRALESGSIMEMMVFGTVDPKELEAQIAGIDDKIKELTGGGDEETNPLAQFLGDNLSSAEDLIDKLGRVATMDFEFVEIPDLGIDKNLVNPLKEAINLINAILETNGNVAIEVVTTPKVIPGAFGGASAYGTSSAGGGKTLVGELGRELVVSDGRYYTVGEAGAEFVDLKKGDIVFNNSDTERLLKGGAGVRGRALAGGQYAVRNDNPNLNILFMLANLASGAATLANIKKALDQAFANYEHSVFKFEREGGSADDMVNSYLAAQEEIRKAQKKTMNLSGEEAEAYRNELEEKWWEYADRISEIRQNEIDKANEALEKITEVGKVLKDAATEYAEYGAISAGTLQNIINLGGEYISLLQDENGMLVINQERIDELTKAKAEQLALTAALNYANKISDAIALGQRDRIDSLIAVTDDFAAIQWEVIEAKVKDLDINEEQRKQTLANIAALRSLAQITDEIEGEKSREQYYKESHDALEEVISLTEDLIKWESEKLIESLEDEKDAYEEIIRKKKELLETTKEEADRQKEIEKRIKSIAEIQSQINLLSLDDSREAQAQKLALEQELADEQESLADYQSDYYIDAQKKALDDEFDSFAKIKDDEIKLEKERYSSAEKLRQAALLRIETDWGNLYTKIIEWNTLEGNSINENITKNWEKANLARTAYNNNFAAALAGTGAGAPPSSSLGGAKDPLAMGYEKEITAKVNEMRANSAQWWNESVRAKVEAANYDLAAEIEALSGKRVVRGNDGYWYIGNEKLYERYPMFHSGGIAGDSSTLKQDEVMAILKKGEPVLDKEREMGLYRIVDFTTELSKKLGAAVRSAPLAMMYRSNSGVFRALDALGTEGGYGQTVFAPKIEVNIAHTGNISDTDAARYGRMIADTAISRLGEAFTKKGVINTKDNNAK